MNLPLILLHEEALRMTHPVFQAAPAEAKALFIWDDAYFRKANYSLKRLVFIYETLCELPIDIIHGSTTAIVQELSPSALYMPATNNPLIVEIIHDLNSVAPVHTIEDEAFVVFKKPVQFRRFFQYWNKAEKTAFLTNGGVNA
jgi:hypothetical protein